MSQQALLPVVCVFVTPLPGLSFWKFSTFAPCTPFSLGLALNAAITAWQSAVGAACLEEGGMDEAHETHEARAECAYRQTIPALQDEVRP